MTRDAQLYPRALAVLAELALPPSARAKPVDEPLERFQIGPSIMRPPPEVQAPASVPRPVSLEGGPVRSQDELAAELVDMVLVGGEDGGPPQVQLQFKADVFGGVLLMLKREDKGLLATFIVDDAASRRAILPHVDTLLARLTSRGMKIAGHAIELRER
jgi:hypothetical protein